MIITMLEARVDEEQICRRKTVIVRLRGLGSRFSHVAGTTSADLLDRSRAGEPKGWVRLIIVVI